MIYAWRHPASIERSVMVGVNPPGHFLWTRADRRANDPHLGSLRQDVRRTVASMRRTRPYSRATGVPDPAGQRGVASFFGLMEATERRADLGAYDARHLARRERGDAPACGSCRCGRRGPVPRRSVWGDSLPWRASTSAPTARVSTSRATRSSVISDPGSDFIWGGGELATAWPAAPADNAYARCAPHACRRC